MNKKTAIVIGATGLTGGLLLERLIADDSYAVIKLFSRREIENASPKIKQFVGDIIKLEQFNNSFTGDIVYCCIGTTAAKTKDKSIYEAIDLGIPSKAAIMAKENKISTFIVISASGANAKSNIFYNRLKGRMEEAVLSMHLPHTYILRPSLIKGNRTEPRLGETIASFVMALINPLLVGTYKKYRAIKAETVAIAMYKLPEINYPRAIIESDQIEILSKEEI